MILGMHRCGTSLTARIANLLGLDLGRDASIIPPGADNPAGYWEQDPIRRVNDAIFEALGGQWYRPPDMPTGWSRRAEVRALAADAREALAAVGFDRAGTWGWKDPRASLTLPFWRPLLAARTRCVVCVRSPADVIASLLEREPQTHTPESAFHLWLRYTGAALRNTARHPRLLVLYDDLLDRIDAEIDRLAGFIGREPELVAPGVRARIRGFVDPALRHHSTPPAQAARLSEIPIEGRTLYTELVVSRLLEDDRAGHAGRALRGLIEPLRRPAPELVDAYEERRRAALVVARVIEEREQFDEAVGQLQQKLEFADARLERAQSQLAASRAKVARLTEAHHRRGEQLKRYRERQQLRKARRDRGEDDGPEEAPVEPGAAQEGSADANPGSGPPESDG